MIKLQTIDQPVLLNAQGVLRSIPVKGGTRVSRAAKEQPTDPWGDQTMGNGGILSAMMYKEMELLQEIGNLQTQITTASMKESATMAGHAADDAEYVLQQDAEATKVNAIQNAVTAGVTGLQGAAMVTSSMDRFNPKLSEANTKVEQLEGVQKQIQTRSDALEIGGDEPDPAVSANALTKMRAADYDSEVVKNNVDQLDRDATRAAQRDVEQKLATAKTAQQTATQELQNSHQKYQAFGQFATQTTTAVVQGFYVSAIQDKKASLQAISTLDQSSADIWKQSASQNSQNVNQSRSARDQMERDIIEAMRAGTRA